MDERGVLVVGETPSLGRSVLDLLESSGIRCRFVYSVEEEMSGSHLADDLPVVIVASNAPFCATARRWVRGELAGVSLVVVGSRDPLLASLPGIRIVTLPLRPEAFLALVREISIRTHRPTPLIADRLPARSLPAA